VTWYLSDIARFAAEQEGLERFSLEVDWLVTSGWRIDKRARLVLDAEIAAGGRVYPVYIRYPELFPHTPPSVYPRGDAVRWSSHQFGAGGELCLEYGPDNWTPDFTGVHLVVSTHRLLTTENPVAGQVGAVPSRHRASLGQQLRSEYSRLLLTRNAQEFLSTIPVRSLAACNLFSAYHKEVVVHVINKITLADGTEWTDESVPQLLAEGFEQNSVPIFRIAPDDVLPNVSSLQEFEASCVACGLNIEHRYAIILQGSDLHAYLRWKEDNSILKIAVIPAQTEAQRLDASHQVLQGKHVALIGCGSLGSKLGTMLARAGVGRFLLVDDDLLFPDNLVRNDLDWRDVGTHKGHALARRMQLVNPAVKTRVWCVRFAGQESSGSAASVLKTIAECDFVFDATANPDALNLASAVAAYATKPVMWAEVFGGGIGGLIARCRPGIEPAPQYMRRAIENWFGERGPPPVRSIRSYETGQDGPPLIADDADVSVIAAHAARLAIDTLIGREPSLFPNSVYAIGLGVGSVFTQPFHTFPIEVGPAPLVEPQEELSAEAKAAEFDKIVKLFEALANETASATEDHQARQA